MLQNIATYLSPGSALYEVLFVFFILFFCYFYTAVVLTRGSRRESQEVRRLYPGGPSGKEDCGVHRQGGYPHHTRGAIYVASICVLPDLLISKLNVPYYFGGTSLMIAVVTARDTVTQIESHLLTRHYKGFLRSRHDPDQNDIGDREDAASGSGGGGNPGGDAGHGAPGDDDQRAESLCRSVAARAWMRPAFKGYRGFPASICASPNEVVVHGFLRNGLWLRVIFSVWIWAPNIRVFR